MPKDIFGRSRTALTMDTNPRFSFSFDDTLDQISLILGVFDFPKDRLRSDHRDLLGVCSRVNHRREIATHNRAVKLLASSALVSDEVASLRVARCTRQAPCRSPICWLCKHLYTEYQRRLARDLFRRCDRDGVAWVTILVEVIYGGPDQIGDSVDTAKQRIRDLFREAAKRNSAFGDLRWLGQFEVDHLPSDGIAAVSSRKLDTLSRMDGFRSDHEAPFQLVHIHMLIKLGQVEPSQLRYQLRKAFPGSFRVRVEPLRKTRSVRDNIDYLVGYMTKCHALEPATDKKGISRRFSLQLPDNRLAYHARLHHHLGGLGGKLSFNSLGRRSRRTR